MVETRRRRYTSEMAGMNSSAPLANVRETDVDFGIDSGFGDNSDRGGVDEGLNGTEITPRINPVGRGVERGHREPTPSPGARGGYFPVYNPGNKPGPGGKIPMDVNLYATKKTVAQGMMDLALLTANANQLRYVLNSHSTSSMYYYVNISFICSSIVLQVIIGIALIFLGRYNVSHEDHAKLADRLNNWIVLGVFLITVINVFVSAFGIEPLGDFDPDMLEKMRRPSTTPNIENF